MKILLGGKSKSEAAKEGEEMKITKLDQYVIDETRDIFVELYALISRDAGLQMDAKIWYGNGWEKKLASLREQALAKFKSK